MKLVKRNQKLHNPDSPLLIGEVKDGDVVKEVSDACREYGLEFGVYLSPWDRHEATYGTGEEYNTYFKNQLTELATKFGDIFCFWFDGACGEGKNGKKQVYDWNSYFELIRELQPNAVINICGPDVRWCGNEAGKSRESEWSIVPYYVSNQDYVAEHSQQEDDPEFSKRVEATTQDLGSRKAIEGCKHFIWYPAEVDVSIRPGWFYHPEEEPHSLDRLFRTYINSVGGNTSFNLETGALTSTKFSINAFAPKIMYLNPFICSRLWINVSMRLSLLVRFTCRYWFQKASSRIMASASFTSFVLPRNNCLGSSSKA